METASVPAAHLEPNSLLVDLRHLAATHPIWNCSLLKAFEHGYLTKEDCKYVFGQYFAYSKNFTRYLSALMATCENDYFRSRLSENLWEEGGGAAPQDRHAEIFRQFLKQGLDIDIATLAFEDCARLFTSEYLNYCLMSHPAATSAFLSLGTEGIVSRLYQVFCNGLLKAGVADEHLRFFHIHIGCDDEHAETLEHMLMSYAHVPNFAQMALEGLNRALDLRLQFFDSLYAGIKTHRLQTMLDRIQSKQSLLSPEETLHARVGDAEQALYHNKHDKLNIDFTVTRLPFACEVLDPRIVRIAPGKANENHKHAHETVFCILKGEGHICLDDKTLVVKEGDLVFVPRWCMHQSHNDGDGEMVILALADFGLTGKAFVGNYLRTARMKQAQETAALPV